MKQFHYISLFYFILLTVQAQPFRAWMNITGSRILQEDASISCSYVSSPGEVVSYVYIWPAPFLPTGFYFMMTLQGEVYLGPRYHNRMSANVNSWRATGKTDVVKTMTMKIENLQCSDEHEYGCTFQYSSLGQTTINSENFSYHLIVRARPSPTVVTIESPDLHLTGDQVWLPEQSLMVAKCKANVGRPGLGTITWKVARNNVSQYISHNDSRVRTMRNDTRNCTEHVEQWLTLEATKGDKKLKINCFVHNSDFPININLHCGNQSSQLCGETQEVSIFTGDDSDEMTGFYIAGLVLLAGFLSAVFIDLLYHYFWAKKPPPPPPPAVKPVAQEPEYSDAVEENESLAEEQFDESDEGTQV